MTLATTVANRWFTERRGLVTGILASAGVLGQMVFPARPVLDHRPLRLAPRPGHPRPRGTGHRAPSCGSP